MITDIITSFFLSKIVVLVINITAVFLAFLVYRDDPHRKLNKIYLVTTVLMLTWVNFAYIPRLIGVSSHDSALLLLKIAWFATPLFFAMLYYLTVNLINKSAEYKWLSRIVLVLGVASAFVAFFTDFVVADLEITGDVLSIIYGSYILPFLILVFLLVIATLLPVFRNPSVLKDKRIQYFLVGLFIFYLQNILFNILLPIFLGVSQYYFLGDYSTLILLGFTAFAIIRYRLFNIKTVAAEFFTFSIWIMLAIRVSRDTLAEDIVMDSLLLTFSIIFGTLLIKSVLGEVKQKEELQVLSGKLQNLNDHLQEKVAEQTVEIRRAYEVEKKARIELEELDKTKDQFILTTQHHLRTPLTIIKGYLSVIKEDPSLSKNSISNLEKISNSTDTLSQFINDLLQITELKVRQEDNKREK